MSKIRVFVAVLFGKLRRFHSVSCGNKKGCRSGIKNPRIAPRVGHHCDATKQSGNDG